MTLTTAVARHYGVGFLLLGLLPHGIPESLAWILAGACSFLLSRQVRTFFFRSGKSHPKRDNDRPLQAGKTYGLLITTMTFLLFVAGILEAYVSPHLISGH